MDSIGLFFIVKLLPKFTHFLKIELRCLRFKNANIKCLIDISLLLARVKFSSLPFLDTSVELDFESKMNMSMITAECFSCKENLQRSIP